MFGVESMFGIQGISQVRLPTAQVSARGQRRPQSEGSQPPVDRFDSALDEA
jgi:hypothetical protein